MLQQSRCIMPNANADAAPQPRPLHPLIHSPRHPLTTEPPNHSYMWRPSPTEHEAKPMQPKASQPTQNQVPQLRPSGTTCPIENIENSGCYEVPTADDPNHSSHAFTYIINTRYQATNCYHLVCCVRQATPGSSTHSRSWELQFFSGTIDGFDAVDHLRRFTRLELDRGEVSWLGRSAEGPLGAGEWADNRGGERTALGEMNTARKHTIICCINLTL